MALARSLLKASLGNGAGVRLLAWTDITSRDGQEAHQQKYYKADFDVLLVGLAEGGEETIAGNYGTERCFFF